MTRVPTATAAGIVVDGVEHRETKRFFEATHRVCSPRETLERVRPYHAAAGITRVADVSGLDVIPISTVIAHRPNSRTLAAGSGKGFTKEAATASAVMEAIELHHAEFTDLDVRSATYNDLADGDVRVVALDDLLLTRENIFSVDRPERWVQAWDLMSHGRCYVPLDLIDMGGHYWSHGWRPYSFQVGSNGLASGNVLLEAVLAGLYECVERDATTSWKMASSYLGVAMPIVDLDTIDHGPTLDLIERLRSVDIELELADCRTDTDVPTFLASIVDRASDLGRYAGYGTHLDPGVAMVRAITEAVQGRVVYVAGSRDDVFDHARHLINRTSDIPLPKLVDLDAPIDAASIPSEASDTFEADISLVLDKLRRAGLHSALVVDLTKPDFGIPVVRVVVPGLEGYTFRHYRAGRRALAFLDRMRERLAERT